MRSGTKRSPISFESHRVLRSGDACLIGCHCHRIGRSAELDRPDRMLMNSASRGTEWLFAFCKTIRPRIRFHEPAI